MNLAVEASAVATSDGPHGFAAESCGSACSSAHTSGWMGPVDGIHAGQANSTGNGVSPTSMPAVGVPIGLMTLSRNPLFDAPSGRRLSKPNGSPCSSAASAPSGRDDLVRPDDTSKGEHQPVQQQPCKAAESAASAGSTCTEAASGVTWSRSSSRRQTGSPNRRRTTSSPRKLGAVALGAEAAAEAAQAHSCSHSHSGIPAPGGVLKARANTVSGQEDDRRDTGLQHADSYEAAQREAASSGELPAGLDDCLQSFLQRCSQVALEGAAAATCEPVKLLGAAEAASGPINAAAGNSSGALCETAIGSTKSLGGQHDAAGLMGARAMPTVSEAAAAQQAAPRRGSHDPRRSSDDLLDLIECELASSRERKVAGQVLRTWRLLARQSALDKALAEQLRLRRQERELKGRRTGRKGRLLCCSAHRSPVMWGTGSPWFLGFLVLFVRRTLTVAAAAAGSHAALQGCLRRFASTLSAPSRQHRARSQLPGRARSRCPPPRHQRRQRGR